MAEEAHLLNSLVLAHWQYDEFFATGNQRQQFARFFVDGYFIFDDLCRKTAIATTMIMLTLITFHLTLHFIERYVKRSVDIVRTFLCPQDKALTMNRHLRHLSICSASCSFFMGNLHTDLFNLLEVTFKFVGLLFDVILEVICQPHITC